MIQCNSGRDIVTAVIEPNALYREGLASILSSAKFNVIASAATVDSDLLSSLEGHERKLIILGAAADTRKTISQIKLLHDPTHGASGHGAHIAVLGNHLDPQAMLSLIKAGARACLTRDTTSESLVSSLELIMSGVLVVPPEIMVSVISREDRNIPLPNLPELDNFADTDLDGAFDRQEIHASQHDETPHLSAQEKRILRYLVEGASNKIIARKVDIAEATVKVHVKAILRKVRLQNRTQAAVWALNHPYVFEHSMGGAPERTEQGAVV